MTLPNLTTNVTSHLKCTSVVQSSVTFKILSISVKICYINMYNHD